MYSKVLKRTIAVMIICSFVMTPLSFAGAKTNYSGACKINKVWYMYTDKGKKVKKTKTIRNVKYYISKDKKHSLLARKYGNKFYYPNGYEMTKADSLEFETQLRAERIVEKLKDPKLSKFKNLRKCFDWVVKFPYYKLRKYKNSADWPAVYANDIFQKKGGACQSDAAAFGYLAIALGYEKVKLCQVTAGPFHTWTEINGKYFDANFADEKKEDFARYKHWNAEPYQYKTPVAERKFKLPYAKSSHNKNGKKIPDKTPKIVSKKNTKKEIERWDKKKKQLFYSDGSRVKGIVYWKNKFYAFNSKGVYRSKYTAKIRKAAKKGKEISALKKLLKKPISKEYEPSCGEEIGLDGIWQYKQFSLQTFKYEDSGKEIYVGAFEK